jgi:hypothetical protein
VPNCMLLSSHKTDLVQSKKIFKSSLFLSLSLNNNA